MESWLKYFTYMSNLYVIGNGFDLKHGLPSHYSDFACFIRTKNIELYNKVNELFPDITRSSLWSNFEEGLGSVDIEKLKIMYNQNSPQNDKFLELHNDLKLALREWVILLKSSMCNLKKYYIFNPSDCFISFNYTNTLEEVYNICNGNILHIHGYATTGNEEMLFADYIFGHKQPEETSYENIDSFDYLYKDLKNAFRKKINLDVLKNKINEWKNVVDFEKIVILGHSINPIDDEYFNFLLTTFSDITWAIDYIDNRDLIKRFCNIKRLEVNGQPLQIEFIHS